ncbi:unnamed protein product [Peronospora effusa]|nr:unnamed protein product [Peronospora effusa]
MESPRSRRNRLARERRARKRALETDDQREARLQIQNATERARRAARSHDVHMRYLRDNREAHAARRAEQSEEVATVQRRIDRNAHAARRAAQSEEVTAEQRRIDRNAHAARRAEEPEVPLARRIIDADAPTLRHVLQRMNVRCQSCQALHWIEERIKVAGSTLGNPTFTMCCERGKVFNIPPLVPPPEPLNTLLHEQTPLARAFRSNIRGYNNALSFTSLGAKLDDRFVQGGVYTFRLQGALYHRMGALLPDGSRDKKYAQLYIADSNAALNRRMTIFPSLDRRVMGELQAMLEEVNPYVQLYEQARQRMHHDGTLNLELRLLCLKSNDRRRYNTPTADEIGAIMVGDGHDGSISDRDIIIKRRNDGGMQRISALHSAYTPLHYVLLFPDGRQGWTSTMPLRGFAYREGDGQSLYVNDEVAVRGRGGSSRISQMQYYSYMLHPRASGQHLFLAGRLLQRYIVDAWASRIGRKMILPSSFAGSDRQMSQLYQDAMAIVRKYGRPDLFVTFTCNPKWPEIRAELEPGQQPHDRPELVARLFNLKLQELMRDFSERKIFGTVVGKVWVIEFQKRGLPHAHILIILDEASKLHTPQQIDSAVSAEIPDPATHPDAYETVKRCSVHGPCGIDKPNAPCMVEGKCSKRYPRVFATETSADHDGYSIYRRRDNGRYIEDAKGRRVDNRWIVPHNLYLSSKYNAHINVEICSSISAIKYVFKYVYKGHDRTTVVVQDVNEIQQYIDARYVSAPESCWRIFGFKMHDHYPPIQRLQVHLPYQQQVVFNANGSLVAAVNNEQARKTTLTQWFELNRLNIDAQETTYLEFPSRFVWNINRKQWTVRQRGKCVGRLYFVIPKAGDRYFLRTLLTTVKGAKSYEDLRTYNGLQYETFKAACVARGLYENDEEWEQCLQEAAGMQSGGKLRSLFVTILIHGPPANPRHLWDIFQHHLSDDLAHRLRQDGNAEPSYDQITSLALHLVANLLAPFEKTLADFSLPTPAYQMEEAQGNRLIAEQLAFNKDVLKEEAEKEEVFFSLMDPVERAKHI